MPGQRTPAQTPPRPSPRSWAVVASRALVSAWDAHDLTERRRSPHPSHQPADELPRPFQPLWPKMARSHHPDSFTLDQIPPDPSSLVPDPQPAPRPHRTPPPDGPTPIPVPDRLRPELTELRRSPHPSQQPADWPRLHRAPQTVPAPLAQNGSKMKIFFFSPDRFKTTRPTHLHTPC